MQTNWLTRFQIIFLYFISQAVIPIIGLILLAFLGIYIINFFFIQPEKLAYLSEIYVELVVVLFLTSFCAFVSIINIVLNLIKFGKTNLVENLVTKSKFITDETKLYYYTITGNTTKSLEIAGKFTDFKKRDTTRMLVTDAYLQAKKFKKIQALLDEFINPLEYDLLLSRKAIIALKRDKDNDKALKLALEALETNRKSVVRNSDPKLLEIKIILAEIYLARKETDKAIEALLPFEYDLIKYPFYSCCKYSKYLIAWYCLVYAKALHQTRKNSEEVKFYLNKCIESFPQSVHAKEAKNLVL